MDMIELMKLEEKIKFWQKKAREHYLLAREHFQLKNYVLETVTGFNIEARYEDYKETLKKKADKKYTQRYLILTGEYLTWFSKHK